MTIAQNLIAATGVSPASLAGKAVGAATALAAHQAAKAEGTPFEEFFEGVQAGMDKVAHMTDGARTDAVQNAQIAAARPVAASGAPMQPVLPMTPAQPPVPPTVEGIHQMYADLRALRGM